ncbi:MAG: hypothetical protein AVDCRST_MAG48-2935, partial [uncultured Friedmanniella sp.]
ARHPDAPARAGPAAPPQPGRDGDRGGRRPARHRGHLVPARGRRPGAARPRRHPGPAEAPASRPARLADRAGRRRLVHPRQPPGPGRGGRRGRRAGRDRPAGGPVPRHAVPQPGEPAGRHPAHGRTVARVGVAAGGAAGL